MMRILEERYACNRPAKSTRIRRASPQVGPRMLLFHAFKDSWAICLSLAEHPAQLPKRIEFTHIN